MVTPDYEVVEAFCRAMRDAGLPPPEHVTSSGQLKRFHVEGDRRGSRNGWYVLYLDGLAAGAFGSWRTGLRTSWHWTGNGRVTLSPEQREEIRAARERREAEAAADRERRTRKALDMWERARPAEADHPYLKRKRVQPHGIRQLGKILLVPVYRASDSVFRGLQRVYPSGDKRFTAGADPKGACYAIGRPRGRIVLAEGFATGATIHQATGDCVVVAFNAGNLLPVATAVRERQPDLTLIVAADNDMRTEGNPGLVAATEAAKVVNGLLAVPMFGDDQEGSDFNDVEALVGGGAVAKQVLAAENPAAKTQPLFDFDAGLVAPLLSTDPPRRRMLVESFLPANEVGAIAAAGGTGKGWFILQLAVSIATGLPFFGLGVVEAGEVLILSGEDRRDEVHRRLHEIVRRAEQVGLIVDRGLLGSRLSVISRVGDENLLTTLGPEGEIHRTQLVDRFLLSLRGREHLKLVVFDPTSRFRGGHENSSEHTTRYVEVLEHVREETRGFVLTSTHVNKFGVKEGGGAEMVRGSSALVDNVRWVLTMQRLRPDQASEYDVEPSEASRYTRIDLPKTNYTSGWPGMWTRREAGVLVPCELKRVANGAKRAKADEEYEDVSARLISWFETKGPQPKRQIKEAAGRGGPFGAGENVVLSMLHRALGEGRLACFPGTVPRGNGHYPAELIGTPTQRSNHAAD